MKLAVSSDSRTARHAPDGTYVSANWKKRIDSFKPYIEKDTRIWSTYTGLYDSMANQLNASPGGEDYIIHALGPERRKQYTDKFIESKPEYVVTLKSTYFWYEEWLWSRHWDFYETLYQNYSVVASNDAHVLWKRNHQGPKTPAIEASSPLTKSADGLYTANVGSSSTPRLYSIKINYEIKNKNPVNEKFSRNLLVPSGTSIQRFSVSLPPYEKEWSFPIALAPSDSHFSLSPKTYGLIPTTDIVIKNISYKEISLSRVNEYPIYNLYCSFGGNYDYPELGTQYRAHRCSKEASSLEYYKQITRKNIRAAWNPTPASP